MDRGLELLGWACVLVASLPWAVILLVLAAGTLAALAADEKGRKR